MCGTYPVKADDDYTLNSVWFIEDYSGNNSHQLPMPQETIYPHLSSSAVNQTLVLTSTTTYTLAEQIRYEEGMHCTYITPTVVQGAQTGFVTAWSQRITYTNTDSDTFKANLHVIESRGGTGTVTIYFQKNGQWVEGAIDNFENTYNSGDLLPDTSITGWRFDIRYTLNSRFNFLNPNTHSNGYKFNSFELLITSSADQQAETLNDIKENTNRTNGLLGIIKDVIDDIVDKIGDTIDAITELPTEIMNGLKSLFIPTDFYGDLQSGLEDIIDSLGIIGYPITYYTDTLAIIRDTNTESMAVEIPAFYWQGKVIFPRYYRSNIFYFKDTLVFENVQKTSWLRNMFGSVGLDIDTVTIGEMVKTFMGFALFFGLIGFVIRMYNSAFGTDMEDDSDDN